MIVYPKSVDFFNPLKRLKLGSFTTILKKPAKMKSYKVVQFSFQSNIFGKIAIIQQSSNVDLKEVFCYPLEPVPWSIAYGAGDMIKTNKSASITEQGSGVWDLGLSMMGWQWYTTLEIRELPLTNLLISC